MASSTVSSPPNLSSTDSNNNTESNAGAATTPTPPPQPVAATTTTTTSTSTTASTITTTTDGEELQSLFSRECDEDGLMSKETLVMIPELAEMLSDGDLLPSELNDIWNAAPKFPTMQDRIDVDSFIQIYRDIDDLFEDDDQDDTKPNSLQASTQPATTTTPTAVVAVATQEMDQKDADDQNDNDNNEGDDDDDDEDEDEDEEDDLETIFDNISKNGETISRQRLRAWSEISQLMNEGLLNQGEFDRLWESTMTDAINDEMDLQAFLRFNTLLDDLFETESDDEDEEEEEEKTMVAGDGLSPSDLFSALANKKTNLMQRSDLDYWGDLQDMLKEKDIYPEELYEMFVANSIDGTLDEIGFSRLYQSIYNLFEDDDDDDEGVPETVESIMPAKEPEKQTTTTLPKEEPVVIDPPKAKSDLMDALSTLQEEPLEDDTLLEGEEDEDDDDKERLPCGLDFTEREEKLIDSIVKAVEASPYNWIQRKGRDNISGEDLAGEWELIYSSSSGFKFNKGISGFASFTPGSRFGGLRQKLSYNKYLSEIEYTERIEMSPSVASFDVQITGTWELRRDESILTGRPILAMRVEPERISYGPMQQTAKFWKTIQITTYLDMTYLDEDLRVMRGTTVTDSIFMFRRIPPTP